MVIPFWYFTTESNTTNVKYVYTQIKNNSQFTERSDEVVCAFCSQSVHNWEPEDIPMEVHKKFSPACPFLSGLAVNGTYQIYAPTNVKKHDNK